MDPEAGAEKWEVPRGQGRSERRGEGKMGDDVSKLCSTMTRRVKQEKGDSNVAWREGLGRRAPLKLNTLRSEIITQLIPRK